MGSLGCLGDMCSAPFLGLQADTLEHLYGETQLTSSAVDSEWHSICLDDSNQLEVEYRFQLVNDDGVQGLSGARDHKQDGQQAGLDGMEAGAFEFTLCELSRCMDSGARGGRDEETKSLINYPNGLRSDRAFVTMETVGGSNGVKEVRVCFHSLDDGAKENVKSISTKVEEGHDHPVTETVSEDSCLSLVSGIGALISGAKLSLTGILYVANNACLWENLTSYFQAGCSTKLWYSSPSSVAAVESLCESPPIAGVRQHGVVAAGDASEVQEKTMVPPSGTPRAMPMMPPSDKPRSMPACETACQARMGTSYGDQRKFAPVSPPGTTKPPLHPNCKKPPRPPRSPSEVAAAAEKRAARKRIEKQPPKRKPRIPPPASLSLTPLVALAMTIGFAILMVFQGVFVQSGGSYGQIGSSLVLETGLSSPDDSAARSVSLNFEPGLSAATTINVRVADSMVANSFHKSMLDLHQRKGRMGVDYR